MEKSSFDEAWINAHAQQPLRDAIATLKSKDLLHPDMESELVAEAEQKGDEAQRQHELKEKIISNEKIDEFAQFYSDRILKAMREPNVLPSTLGISLYGFKQLVGFYAELAGETFLNSAENGDAPVIFDGFKKNDLRRLISKILINVGGKDRLMTAITEETKQTGRAVLESYITTIIVNEF